MKTAQKILEIEALCENLAKQNVEAGLLRIKVLYFVSEYENLSVSMIIEKLGIKKSNFALLTAQLQKEGCLEINKTEIDKRCRTLKLTEKGREELSTYLSSLEERLGATDIIVDESLDILLKYLNRKVWYA